MGCHMWLYKKANNLTLEEKKNLIENAHKYCYRTFVQNISREDFIAREVKDNVEDLKKFEDLIAKGIMDSDDYQYELAKEFADPEKIAKWYDESVEINRKRKDAYEAFCKDPNYIDFIELYKILGKDNSSSIKYHNNECYVNIIFDTYFRCYEFSYNDIDSYEDMIKFLENVHPNMIEQYGKFDENEKFYYYDNKNYTPKKGLTDELKVMLKFLYKDNDIFIEFA